MSTVPVFWFSKAFKFFAYSMLVTVTIMIYNPKAFKFFAYSMLVTVTIMIYNPRFDFWNAKINHLCSLCKKKREKWPLFCYARKHFTIWVFNIFSKEIVECCYVHLTVGYLSILKPFTMVPVKRASLWRAEIKNNRVTLWTW